MNRRTLLIFLCIGLPFVGLLGCGGPSRPRLIVLVAVDQMRADYLTRFKDEYQGGFKTLLDHGAVFNKAAYRHAVTVTAAGHATISTGMHPSHTGMVGNTWYDLSAGKEVNCIADGAYEPVGGPGRKASPTPLLEKTIGDRLKEAHPASRVYSVSWKDRAAILMAGRGADAAFWFSDACGCFITSSYYQKTPPDWLTAFNDRKLADTYAGKSWERLLDDAALYDKLSREDDFESERPDSVFPHQLPATAEAGLYDALGRTPFNDELILQAALSLVDAYELGADDEPDVLAVSFSATDLIGHRYGPFSQEAMDNDLRLDRTFGKLLDGLDERVGLEHVALAFTADHGAVPAPEDAKHAPAGARRILSEDIAKIVDEAVRKRFPKATKVVASINTGNVYLNLDALSDVGIARDPAEQVAKEALLEQDWVEEVFIHADMLDESKPSEGFLGLYRNSFFARRSPHLFVRLCEGCYPGALPGTGHGSPYLYDRAVPVVFLGPAFNSGEYDAESGPEDIAPTIAKTVGIDMPVEPDSRILSEALRGQSN